jgi:hypothetical protein
MSDNDPTGESPVFRDSTELMTVPDGNVVPTDHLADLDDWEDDEEWVSARPQRGLRLGWPTAVLLVLLLAAGGFYGGAELQKHHGSSATSGRTAALAALRGAATRGGFGGTGAAGSAATAGLTTGTVTDVNGNVLYVTDASGGAVKVTLTPQTKVTRNASSTPAGLLPGDTVIVQGAKAANGSVAASTISASAPGVAATTGGFGGAGGRTGGFSRAAG